MADSEPPRPAASQTGSLARAHLSSACTVLGVVILTLGFLFAYASRVIFNSEAFADRLAASLPDPGVSAFIAERVTQGLIAKQRDLTAFQPLIFASMRTLIASEPFRGMRKSGTDDGNYWKHMKEAGSEAFQTGLRPKNWGAFWI